MSKNNRLVFRVGCLYPREGDCAPQEIYKCLGVRDPGIAELCSVASRVAS